MNRLVKNRAGYLPPVPPRFLSVALIISILIIASFAVRAEESFMVRDGDTLFKIARDRLGDEKRWKELADLNGLRPPYKLTAGAALRLPGGEEPAGDSAAEEAAPVAEEAAPPAKDEAPPPPLISDASPVDHVLLFTPAPDPPENVTPLEELVAELHRKNPSIRASERAAEAARHRPSQAGSLPDPMLRASVRFDQQRVGMVDPSGMVSFPKENMTMEMFQISQMIPVGKLEPMKALENRMADQMAAMTGMERATAERRLKTAYVELFFTEKSSVVLRRIRDILKLLVESTQAMYKVGEAKQSDILRAQLEISMIGDRLLMLEGRRRASVEDVNALLDRPAGTPVGGAMSLAAYDPPAADKSEAAPLLHIASAGAKTAAAKVKVAESMFIPDVEVMGGTMLRPGLDPRWEVGVGLTLPIWSGTKQAPAVREAETLVKEAEERLRVARTSIQQNVENALAMAWTARSQSLLYEQTIIPQARLTWESSLSNYRVGSVDFMTVVENLTTLLGYEIANNESVANFYKSLAMVEEMTGREMEWRGR